MYEVITLLQILTLHKPGRTSKTKDHMNHLKRRLTLWKAGDLQALLVEEHCIQNRLLNSNRVCKKSTIAKTF